MSGSLLENSKKLVYGSCRLGNVDWNNDKRYAVSDLLDGMVEKLVTKWRRTMIIENGYAIKIIGYICLRVPQYK